MPADGRSLRANFTALSIGRLFTGASQFLVIVVLAKVSDSPAIVGMYAFGVAVSVPILEFARLGLREIKVTDARHEHRFSELFGLRILSAIAALLVIALVAFVFGPDRETAVVICLVGLSRSVLMQSDIFYGLFQSQERLDFVARSLILQSVMAITFLAGGLIVTGSLLAAILAQAFANLLVLWFHDIGTARRRLRQQEVQGGVHPGDRTLAPAWDRAALVALVWRGIPLGLAGLLAALSLNATRYVVAGELGVAQLGYLAAMLSLVMAPNRLIHSLGTAATARLARHYARGDWRSFVVLLAKVAGVGLAIGAAVLAGVALAGAEILTLFYAPDYAEYAHVFTWIMAGTVVRYVAALLRFGVVAARRFWLTLGLQALVTAVAFAASYVFITRYGLEGAAFAIIATVLVQLTAVCAVLGWLIARAEPQTQARVS